MRTPSCRHIKTNGSRCQSPALNAQDYCYFHARLYQRHAGFRHAPEARGYLIPGQHIELNPLEDRESVQMALSVVINALATGQLETRRATALLYGLQLASMNAATLRQPHAVDVVRSFESSPEGHDLASLPAPRATTPALPSKTPTLTPEPRAFASEIGPGFSPDITRLHESGL